MQRGPLLEHLSGGVSPLVEAQAALVVAREAWRRDPRCAALLDGLAIYGAGGTLSPSMDVVGARALAAALLDHMVPALAAHPLGHAPFRNGCDGGTRTMLLEREGRALLLLVVREPGSCSRRAVGFNAGELHEFVLAGQGSGRIARRAGVAVECENVRLAPDVSIALDQSSEALLVDAIDARLVSLRLIRLPGHSVPTREYALDTGELLHQSSSDSAESCHEFALALLGRMGRTDAAPLMAEMACAAGPATSDHLRWQALRECIALDTEAGLAALRGIAGDPADSLFRPATALLAQLCAAHPELESA